MPGRFALDSSVMVAAVCTWHERHRDATVEIEQRLAAGQHLAVAAHALAEAYAVLTRLPAPHRLAPADAWALVHTNFIKAATVVALTGPGLVKVLAALAAADVGGGRTYDALIAACAKQARVGALLTFNPRHFDPAPEGVAIVEP
ncbi:MAG TPA: PIN domain-containing protein [Vicinamibacterales bacterium]|nr:PIN domain-containing protein [Vicinamibacterales bacterium]